MPGSTGETSLWSPAIRSGFRELSRFRELATSRFSRIGSNSPAFALPDLWHESGSAYPHEHLPWRLFMLTVLPSTENGAVVYSLSGRIEAHHIAELEEL